VTGLSQPRFGSAWSRSTAWTGRRSSATCAGSARWVAEVLGRALPPTLLLAGTALSIHLAVGISLGALSATRRGRRAERILDAAGMAIYAMPTFWVGLMALLTLSYLLGLFPFSSTRSVGAEHWSWGWRAADLAWHLALPAGVLGLTSAAAMARVVREGLLRTLGEHFVRAAHARGLGRGRVLLVHALRNALIPVINLVGLSLPALLSGSLVVEVVFAWPGMGRVTYDAMRAHDLPVVLATTLWATLLVVAGSLAADLAMAAADPRVRLGVRGRA
jgi:peptide/nickel transport system permease protein